MTRAQLPVRCWLEGVGGASHVGGEGRSVLLLLDLDRPPLDAGIAGLVEDHWATVAGHSVSALRKHWKENIGHEVNLGTRGGGSWRTSVG